jgi:hypothetical protein
MECVTKIIFVVFLSTLLSFLIVIMLNRSIEGNLIVPSGTQVGHARQQVTKTCLTFASGKNNIGFTEKNKLHISFLRSDGIVGAMALSFNMLFLPFSETASVVWWLACWPLVPEFAGSIPTEAVGFCPM